MASASASTSAAAAGVAGAAAAAAAASGVVPSSAVEALAETLGHAEEVRARLREFLAAADRDALAELPPLRRARAFLVLARAASSVFSVRLRCSGINPDDHPITKELEEFKIIVLLVACHFLKVDLKTASQSFTRHQRKGLRITCHTTNGTTSSGSL